MPAGGGYICVSLLTFLKQIPVGHKFDITEGVNYLMEPKCFQDLRLRSDVEICGLLHSDKPDTELTAERERLMKKRS